MTEFKDHPLYKVHTIDTAMSSIWDFYRKNFLVLFFLSAVIAFVMQYISSFIDMTDLQNETDPMVMLEKIKGLAMPLMMVSLLNLLLTTILQHYILFKPVDSSNNVMTSVIKAFKYYLPYLIILIILSFVGAIAVVLGLLALVVGAVFAAIYILTLYLFILPVMMTEGANIGNTISRVFALAHRNFWSNIGWVSVFFVILLAISLVLSGIILLPFTGSFIKTLFNPEDAAAAVDITKNPLFIILSALVNALTLPLMPIFAGVLYFNARAREEKKEPEYQPEKEENSVRVEDLYAKPYSDEHPENPENK
ncbi:MAG TPA: hypothetical protein VMV47_11870 [Bacteroidales bacterium]|nr:hypothetical protein [Bacteroidales bacterium]